MVYLQSTGPLANVTAAILAGGLGTRLRSIVADRPKVLATVSGRPFLAYQLDQLHQAGITEVVICTGHMAEQVEATFQDRWGGLRLRYSREAAPLGTGGALKLACPLFGSETVLVLNGDSYCYADLPAFARWHNERQARGSLLLAHVGDTSRHGRVQVDPAGQVLAFDEKGRTGAGWINAGIYLLNRALLEAIPDGRPVSLERAIFPLWIAEGLEGYRCEAHFLDIGTPESYAQAEEFFGAGSAA